MFLRPLGIHSLWILLKAMEQHNATQIDWDIILTSQVKAMSNKREQKHFGNSMKIVPCTLAWNAFFASIYFLFHFFGLIISCECGCVFLIFFLG